MLWNTALLAVIVAAPTGRTIDFSDKPPVLAEGKLTQQGRATVLSGLRRVRATEQATLEVCIGEEQALSGQAGGWLARLLAAEGEKLTGKELPWVVRVRSKAECPNSVRLTLSPPMLSSAEVVARVLSSTGPVNAELEDKRELALAADSIVPAGATVKVGTGSCQLLLSDGSHVSLGARTELTFHRVRQGKKSRDVTIRLFIGEIWARVTEAVGPSKWVVRTGNATAGVRGTEFVVVSTNPAKGSGTEPMTSVDVYEGSVELAPRRGKPVVVGSGRRGVVTGSGKPELAELLPAPYQLRPISGSHDSPVELTWKSETKTAVYRVQLAKDVEFNRIVADRQTDEPHLEIETTAGWYFWRVLTLSPDGSRSFPSQLFKIYVE